VTIHCLNHNHIANLKLLPGCVAEYKFSCIFETNLKEISGHLIGDIFKPVVNAQFAATRVKITL
jgi:hypothetical protein